MKLPIHRISYISYPLSMVLLGGALSGLQSAAAQAEPPPTKVSFKKIVLHQKYITEGASIGDINADGHPDVVAGPLWWGSRFSAL